MSIRQRPPYYIESQTKILPLNMIESTELSRCMETCILLPFSHASSHRKNDVFFDMNYNISIVEVRSIPVNYITDNTKIDRSTIIIAYNNFDETEMTLADALEQDTKRFNEDCRVGLQKNEAYLPTLTSYYGARIRENMMFLGKYGRNVPIRPEVINAVQKSYVTGHTDEWSHKVIGKGYTYNI